jgi:hypothetical protein
MQDSKLIPGFSFLFLLYCESAETNAPFSPLGATFAFSSTYTLPKHINTSITNISTTANTNISPNTLYLSQK